MEVARGMIKEERRLVESRWNAPESEIRYRLGMIEGMNRILNLPDEAENILRNLEG